LQFGYRRHYGTQDALSKLFSTISKALDKNKFVVAVFFDISKAFDSINHELLLFKLEKMGIRGRMMDLIKSYLTNRQKFVKIMDQFSEIAAILFGVPQGSCLGPLLFVMMLYDLKFVNTTSTMQKYADDVVMLLTCDKLDDFPVAVSKDINEIKNYYNMNGLNLNASKSKYMTFGFTSHKDLEDTMKANGIEKVDSIKYLGAIVDSKLKMNECADYSVKRIS
jgi:retron-type reverse transcriptase